MVIAFLTWVGGLRTPEAEGRLLAFVMLIPPLAGWPLAWLYRRRPKKAAPRPPSSAN